MIFRDSSYDPAKHIPPGQTDEDSDDDGDEVAPNAEDGISEDEDDDDWDLSSCAATNRLKQQSRDQLPLGLIARLDCSGDRLRDVARKDPAACPPRGRSASGGPVARVSSLHGCGTHPGGPATSW